MYYIQCTLLNTPPFLLSFDSFFPFFFPFFFQNNYNTYHRLLFYHSRIFSHNTTTTYKPTTKKKNSSSQKSTTTTTTKKEGRYFENVRRERKLYRSLRKTKLNRNSFPPLLFFNKIFYFCSFTKRKRVLKNN